MAKKAAPSTDVAIEYALDDATLTRGMRAKVTDRIQRLAGGHRDILGAAVALENMRGTKRNAEYRCRLVLYFKPANIVAVHKAATEKAALLEALDAIERQVRQQRERMWERTRAKRVKRGRV